MIPYLIIKSIIAKFFFVQSNFFIVNTAFLYLDHQHHRKLSKLKFRATSVELTISSINKLIKHHCNEINLVKMVLS
jgi:hypothetical protein